MTSINSITDSDLTDILSNLPLTDLLKIGRVHPRFAFLRSDALTKSLTSFALLLGPTDVRPCMQERVFYRKSVKGQKMPGMWFGTLSTDVLNYLMDTFPVMKQLSIVVRQLNSSVIESLIYLLKHWSSDLSSLKVYFAFPPEDETLLTNRCFDFLATINCLTSLKHLTFEIENCIFGQSSRFDFKFSILARLEEFYFSSFDDLGQTSVLQWLSRYECKYLRNHRLKKLGFGNTDENSRSLAWFGKACPRLARAITDLPNVAWINDLGADYAHRFNRKLFAPYQSLTQLTIAKFSGYFIDLLRTLEPLKQLLSLKLSFNWEMLPLYQYNCTNITKIPQLPTITDLNLSVCVISHADIEFIYWGHVFPGLESLILHHQCLAALEYTYCAECFNWQSPWSMEEQATGTMKHILETFKRCPRLTAITTSKDGRKERHQWAVSSARGKKFLFKSQ